MMKIDNFDTMIQSDEFATEYLEYLKWCEEVEGDLFEKEEF